MGINMFPSAALTQNEIREVSQGVYKLCEAGIKSIVDADEGCSQQVKWYVSQHVKWESASAAIGGIIDVFRGSASSPVASLRVGFSEDANRGQKDGND